MRGTAYLVAGVLLGAASAARADDIHVPGDFRRLQDAIDAAGPGDRVLVDRGTHRDGIEVRTPGIEIVGSPKARVMGKNYGRYRTPLDVLADDVTVRGLRFVGGGFRSSADRTVLEDCTFERYRADWDMRRPVVTLMGNGGTVARNRVEKCRGSGGIVVVGDDARVEGNVVVGRHDDTGIRVQGVRNAIDGNRVDVPLAIGGLFVGGRENAARDNGVAESNFLVLGDENLVEGNRVEDVPLGQASIGVEGDGNLLSGNEIVGGGDTGVLVRGDDNLLEGNSVAGNGTFVDGLPWGHGFVVRGSGNELRGDTAEDCVGEAFRVVGNGTVNFGLDPATGTWGWYPVDFGPGNVLDGCTGTGAGTCGLGNWTVGTSVTDSVFTGNGVDIVSGNDFDAFEGNDWVTGGPGYVGSGNGDETSDTWGLFSNWGGD